MPIDWEEYGRFGKKGLLSAGDRDVVERNAADLLGLGVEAAAQVWGRAVGYGCESAAVIRIDSAAPHRFRERAPEVAVKAFRTAAWKAVDFQRDHLVGRDLPRVQRSFAAEVRAEGRKSRGYAVLEFIPGVSMDRRLEEGPRPGAAVVRDWIVQCLADVVAPLWAQGLRFWDVRPCNLVLSPDGRLTLIDNDLLRHGADDRDHAEAIAVGREGGRSGMLPRLVQQLLRAHGACPESRLKRGVETAWKGSEATEALCSLGRAGSDLARARGAVGRLVEMLTEEGLIDAAVV
jgi:hypothetical protein